MVEAFEYGSNPIVSIQPKNEIDILISRLPKTDGFVHMSLNFKKLVYIESSNSNKTKGFYQKMTHSSKLSSLLLLVLASCGGTVSSSGTSSSGTSGTPTNVANDSFAFALSTNRLNEVDFNISLDELVSSSSNNPSLQRKINADQPLRQSQEPGTVVVDEAGDTLTYTELPDSSNVGLEFRNLNINIENTASAAKSEVDWALENLTIVDRWVRFSGKKYLLQYDAALDIVTLYVANLGFTSGADNSYGLKSISVAYTETGDLLVEVNDAQKQIQNSFTYFAHLRFIKGSLYEWSSDIWVNGIREEVPNAGGPGWFKAVKDTQTNLWMYWRSSYYNASFNIQTPNGWIQTIVPIAAEDIDPTDDVASFPFIKVSSGGLENDVFSFEINETNQTNLEFYPSAFTGWSSIQAPYSSATIRNLTDWTPANQDLALYETTEGLLIVDDETNTMDVPTTVRPSNIDDVTGSMYVGYVATSQLTLDQNYRDILDVMLATFSDLGLGYEHGDLSQLFGEVIAITNNLDRLFNQFSLNGVAGFSTLETLRDVVEEEMDLISSMPARIATLVSSYTEIEFSSLPPVVIGANGLLSINDAINGSVTMNANGSISTSNLTLSLNPTVLLTPGASYAISYGWFVDGFIVPIGQGTSTLYSGSTFTIQGSETFNVTPTNANTYDLVMYLVKVIDENTYLRVSSVAFVPVENFETITLTTASESGFEFTNVYTKVGNNLSVSVAVVDIQAPTMVYIPLEQSFQGVSEANVISIFVPVALPLIEIITFFDIVDNVDQNILFSLDQLTYSEGAILSLNDLIAAGTYTYTFEDTAGNETIVVIEITTL